MGGIVCCTTHDTERDLAEQTRIQNEALISMRGQVQMQPLVNMIPITDHHTPKTSRGQKTIRSLMDKQDSAAK